jgi:hypothetical protein
MRDDPSAESSERGRVHGALCGKRPGVGLWGKKFRGGYS